jgi:hypothetical protein
MSARSVQASLPQHLAAGTKARRRFVPPSLSVPMSQSVDQRWRERPRCPALRVTPKQSRRGRSRHRWSCQVTVVFDAVVQEERAAHVHVRASGFTGTTGRRIARQSACARHGFSWTKCPIAERSFGRSTLAHSMLAPCSASSMLSAPLRPGRRPGLWALTTPPRGCFRQLRDGGQRVISRMRLTRESCRRMLASSRQCRTALPPVADTANGARIRSAPTGHDIERNPKTSQTDTRRPRAVRRHLH